ncbi:hypothetical protein J6590_097008, partial [Homalodisca vitripennis]
LRIREFRAISHKYILPMAEYNGFSGHRKLTKSCYFECGCSLMETAEQPTRSAIDYKETVFANSSIGGTPASTKAASVDIVLYPLHTLSTTLSCNLSSILLTIFSLKAQLRAGTAFRTIEVITDDRSRWVPYFGPPTFSINGPRANGEKRDLAIHD